MPRGPSKPRFSDPAFLTAVTQALRRHKDNKKLKNKDLAKILKVSESRISRLLKDNQLHNGDKAQDLSALSLAMALKAGISVDYDHVQLTARRRGPNGLSVQAEREASLPQQISFVFETGFVCEKTKHGLMVKRKGPASSSTFNVQIKVG